MGMSSSQARLLNLTARMHQIEYKAARLEAQKLQMANESTRVYNDYLNALDSTKIQHKKLNNDGSIGYADATYQAMLDNGYLIEFLESGDIWGKDGIVQAGKITITQEDLDLYNLATSNGIEAGSRDFFIALQTGRVDENGFNSETNTQEIYLSSHMSNAAFNTNVTLMADVDLTNVNYTSKYLSSGKTFDGNGHTVKGLNKVLFSSAGSNSTIKNLSLEGNVTSMAILTNYANSEVTFSDINISGSVNYTSSNVGALVGYASGSNITIERCSTNATVISTGDYVGGLVGRATGSGLQITDCSTSGYVQGSDTIGGFIGLVEAGTITNCSSTSSVYTTYYDYDSRWGTSACSGGFVGGVRGTTSISYCESKGDVRAESMVCGGFCGAITNENASISNCDSYGNVYGHINSVWADSTHSNECGGFISAVNGGVITNCNAFGTAQSNLTATNVDKTTSFASCDMSGSSDSHISKVVNCYAADTTKPFTYTNHNLDECTQASTPIQNNITVQAPNVTVRENVSDTGDFGKMFDMIAAGKYVIDPEIITDPTNGHLNDSVWFSNMVNAGYIFIHKPDKDDETMFQQTSVSTDTDLQEVADERKLKKAEAEYEAAMKKIDMKDRKYDTDLAALDTERNAIKSEIDTLKTVAKDNVERTFKLFG